MQRLLYHLELTTQAPKEKRHLVLNRAMHSVAFTAEKLAPDCSSRSAVIAQMRIPARGWVAFEMMKDVAICCGICYVISSYMLQRQQRQRHCELAPAPACRTGTGRVGVRWTHPRVLSTARARFLFQRPATSSDEACMSCVF